MTTQNIGLFKALGAKMHYLDQRQTILSQNVANADTPGYRPHDLVPVDFGRVLSEATGSTKVYPVTTNPAHMPAPGQIDDPKNREQKHTYDVAPAGNAVILEEQMVKSNETSMDYNLMTTLYQKNVGMIRTALGVNQ